MLPTSSSYGCDRLSNSASFHPKKGPVLLHPVAQHLHGTLKKGFLHSVFPHALATFPIFEIECYN